MTQVLTCLTPDFVVLVADRLLVDLRTGQAVDDEACKVVLLGSQAVIAFTGLANLKPPPRGQTDLWIVDQLSPPPAELPAIFDKLGNAAAHAFSRISHLGPRAKRHTFVTVGWQGDDPGSLTPFFSTLSNAEDSDGRWLPRAKPDFALRTKPFLSADPFSVMVTGQPLPARLKPDLERRIRNSEEQTSDFVVSALIDAVQITSRTNDFVGDGLLAVVLPRDTAACDRGLSLTPLPDGAQPGLGSVTGPTCFYVPSGSNDRTIFSPHLITPTISMSDVQIHDWALTPEEVKQRYEEGLRKRE